MQEEKRAYCMNYYLTLLLFNFDQDMYVNLNLDGTIDLKNLLSFYKQKIIFLENQNSFLLNQSNSLPHQIDQNNRIVLKILNNNSQVKSNSQKSDNNFQISNIKNPFAEVVKEKMCKLRNCIKTPQKRKKGY